MDRFNHDPEEKRHQLGYIKTYFNTAWKNEHWYMRAKPEMDFPKYLEIPPYLEGTALRFKLDIEITDEDWIEEEEFYQ